MAYFIRIILSIVFIVVLNIDSYCQDNREIRVSFNATQYSKSSTSSYLNQKFLHVFSSDQSSEIDEDLITPYGYFSDIKIQSKRLNNLFYWIKFEYFKINTRPKDGRSSGKWRRNAGGEGGAITIGFSADKATKLRGQSNLGIQFNIGPTIVSLNEFIELTLRDDQNSDEIIDANYNTGMAFGGSFQSNIYVMIRGKIKLKMGINHRIFARNSEIMNEGQFGSFYGFNFGIGFSI